MRPDRSFFGRVFEIKYIYDDASFSFKRSSPDERRSKSGYLLNPNLKSELYLREFRRRQLQPVRHAAAIAVAKNPAKSYNPSTSTAAPAWAKPIS